jgi:formylglycine-generating enzyme required for sulfatase activity
MDLQRHQGALNLLSSPQLRTSPSTLAACSLGLLLCLLAGGCGEEESPQSADVLITEAEPVAALGVWSEQGERIRKLIVEGKLTGADDLLKSMFDDNPEKRPLQLLWVAASTHPRGYWNAIWNQQAKVGYDDGTLWDHMQRLSAVCKETAEDYAGLIADSLLSILARKAGGDDGGIMLSDEILYAMPTAADFRGGAGDRDDALLDAIKGQLTEGTPEARALLEAKFIRYRPTLMRDPPALTYELMQGIRTDLLWSAILPGTTPANGDFDQMGPGCAIMRIAKEFEKIAGVQPGATETASKLRQALLGAGRYASFLGVTLMLRPEDRSSASAAMEALESILSHAISKGDEGSLDRALLGVSLAGNIYDGNAVDRPFVMRDRMYAWSSEVKADPRFGRVNALLAEVAKRRPQAAKSLFVANLSDASSSGDSGAAPLSSDASGDPGPRVSTGIGMTLLRIAPATFAMGSPPSAAVRAGDETQHRVTISEPYWIGETEVTQQQWRAVMGTTPWAGKRYTTTGDTIPATHVSWTDAVAFCARLTEREQQAGRLPAGMSYTLPTEAEWELACRGSATNTSAYCFGDDAGRLGQYAVFGKTLEGGQADPVRSKRPNAFGLYDMHGNVSEWCADSADYSNGVVTDTYRDGVVDPLSAGGAQRVVRGGHWAVGPLSCDSAIRFAVDPWSAVGFLGFRPVLIPRLRSSKRARFELGEGLALLASDDQLGYYAHWLNKANSISDLEIILGQPGMRSLHGIETLFGRKLEERYKQIFGRKLEDQIALIYSEEIHKRLDLYLGVGGYYSEAYYSEEERYKLATILLDIPKWIRTTVAATYQDRFGQPFSKAVGKVGTGWELLGRGERVEGVQVLVRLAHSPEVVESLLKRLTPAEMTEYRKIAGEDLEVSHGRNAAFEPVTLAGLKHMVAGYPNGVGVAKLRSVVVSGHLVPIAENVESIPEGALPGVLADYRAIVGKSFLESAQERLSAEDFKKLRDRLQPRLPVDPEAPK